MPAQLQDLGGRGQPLLFAHANGYPPGSYRALAGALGDSGRLLALEQRPLWGDPQPPQPLHWSLFADDLLQLLRQQFREPQWVMGHSMGATIAVLAADREPQRFAGLILLDPVFLADRRLLAMRLMGRRRRARLPMVRRALRRPQHFPSREAAFSFYRDRRAFAGLDDDALRDYVSASTAPDPAGGLRLRFPAAWEAAIYQSAPRVKPLLRRLELPTLGLRGCESATLEPALWQRWAHWQPAATLRECPGGHLFPLEQPRAAAALIAAFLATQNARA